ncbi:uncharacterized protein PHALS_15041 [Plasmopara halstedii]|uniref:Uncharacterized protein n=1 Tax=Plasmopara halstedii TaxID=4781 RepID=A0A0P1AA01_PLAHL|nr:uncharacterized protein PHALS_15041 [Plasmopara halstedii]CEG37240.1 hypothetical protein PHALS_15041 [Plasmopara halstedii]|eukprot:XP_024573609.1 hypothetical protein PHALS_15041 [Plasmopara halstedii]
MNLTSITCDMMIRIALFGSIHHSRQETGLKKYFNISVIEVKFENPTLVSCQFILFLLRQRCEVWL